MLVYRAATCSVLVLPEVFRIIVFYGDDFTFVFVFYAELGSTADTCTASVYGACGACVSVFSAQLGSTTDTCGASVYVNHIFPGVSVFSAQLGSTADTCGPSVYGVFHFYVYLWIMDPQVDSRPALYSSSCGAHLDVVHCPFGWFYHRCHYIFRDLALFVDRLP